MKEKDLAKISLPPAIVIGLDHIVGLQTARLLAKKGIPVYGIAKNKDHFCVKTKVCEKIYFGDTTGPGLISILEDIRGDFFTDPILFPCRDLSVLIVSRNREKLKTIYRFAVPPADKLEMLMDKISFYEFASLKKLPIPKYFLLHNRQEALEASKELKYPCAIKPAIKTPLWESHTKMKAFKINDRKEFLEIYDMSFGWTDILIAQEWVIGKDSNNYSCNAYFNSSGIPLVTFIAKKLRQYPVETGNTSLGLECREDKVLEESLKLFKVSKLSGLGYLEMKKDDRDGQFYIIEPNIGRPTGRSAIAEAGGVELVHTMYCDLAGLSLPENRTQKYLDVKWIHIRADLLSAINYWRKNELTIREWITTVSGKKTFAVFSLKDPLPFLAEIAQGISHIIDSLYSKLFHKKVKASPPVKSKVQKKPTIILTEPCKK